MPPEQINPELKPQDFFYPLLRAHIKGQRFHLSLYLLSKNSVVGLFAGIVLKKNKA